MRALRPLIALAATAAMVAGAAQSASATSVLVAQWNMDDLGTTMSDSSGHGHVGALHNVSVGQPGFSGKAFGFFGRPSYVSVPTATDLNPGTAAFSITLHVKFSTRPTTADYDLLRKGVATTTGGSYKVEVIESGKVACDFRGSTREGNLVSPSVLTTGVWHTIVCSRTSTSMRLTVDASTVSKAVTTGTISNTGRVYVGAKDSTGDDQLKGVLDAVSLRKG